MKNILDLTDDKARAAGLKLAPAALAKKINLLLNALASVGTGSDSDLGLNRADTLPVKQVRAEHKAMVWALDTGVCELGGYFEALLHRLGVGQDEPASTSREAMVDAMRGIDQVSQKTSEEIRAICDAAPGVAGTSPQAVMRLLDLFAVISDRTLNLENYINAEAEDHGANFVDVERRALEDRLHAEAAGGAP